MITTTHPLLYSLLLAGGVGAGLPMGAAVVAAGALFGSGLGLAVVLSGETLGLLFNWHLCRRWARPRMLRRLQRHRLGAWVQTACSRELSWQTLVLLRLAFIPMLVVSAGCALSSTRWQPYALASLVLILRFGVMVQLGALGSEAISGELSLLKLTLGLVAFAATLSIAVMAGKRLKRSGPSGWAG